MGKEKHPPSKAYVRICLKSKRNIHDWEKGVYRSCCPYAWGFTQGIKETANRKVLLDIRTVFANRHTAITARRPTDRETCTRCRRTVSISS